MPGPTRRLYKKWEIAPNIQADAYAKKSGKVVRVLEFVRFQAILARGPEVVHG